MSTNIPPADINSVLQAQIASREQNKKVTREENDRERSRQEQLRAALEHTSQVEDPDAVEPGRQLRDEDRRRSRNGHRDHRDPDAAPQQAPRDPDQYIPSKEAREQGLAGPPAPAAPPVPPEPPAAPNRDQHILDLEA